MLKESIMKKYNLSDKEFIRLKNGHAWHKEHQNCILCKMTTQEQLMKECTNHGIDSDLLLEYPIN